MTKEEALNLKLGEKFLYSDSNFPNLNGRIWTVIKPPRNLDEKNILIECKHERLFTKLCQYKKMIKI